MVRSHPSPHACGVVAGPTLCHLRARQVYQGGEDMGGKRVYTSDYIPRLSRLHYSNIHPSLKTTDSLIFWC